MAESSTSSLTSTSHTLTVGTVMAMPAAGGNRNSNSNNNNNGVGSIGGLPSLSDISAALAFRDALRQPHRQTFLKPSPALPTAAAQFAQAALGAFASQLGDEQQEQRRRRLEAAARAKRKRGGGPMQPPPPPPGPMGPLLKIRRVHVDGFETPQIWQQSNRILAAGLTQAKQVLEELDPQEGDDEDDEDDDDAAEKAERVGENGVTGSESDEDEVGSEEEGLSAELDDDAEEEEDFDEDDEDEELGLDEDHEDDEEEEEEEEGDEVDEDNGDDDDDDEDDLNLPKKVFVEDQHGLNDGFFDIDEFNKVSQWFEAQDAQADPNTDRADDDDEELDWHADPFSVATTGKRKAPAKKGTAAAANKRAETKKKGRRGRPDSDDEEAALRKAIMNEGGAGDDGDGDDDDDEEDGPPIFGDMDLDAPSGESDNEDMNDDLDGEDLTANDIYYKDFFAPPPRKRQQDDGGAHGRGRPTAADAAAATKARAYQPDDRDVKRAMADVRRDLFEQISNASDVDDDDGVDGDGDDDEDVGALSDASASDPRARRSTHARRQAKILAEIRRLEAAALQAKDWTLQGEAGAGARPINSLLEEELDFEHMGKPVPVITQEVSEDIEALVKRRIVAREFDEVRRRYATDLADESSAQRRGLIEIDDQPGKRGLAAVYEDAHLEAAHPDAYVRPADAQLAADEAEVARLWAAVSAQLDALSSWHYTPRPAAPALTVVADVGTVAMEDAQPATAQGIAAGAGGGTARRLAPQEVYKPGQKDQAGVGADSIHKDTGVVVVPKSGLPVARDEMTREEKKRRRRRAKERIRKSGSGAMNGANHATTNGGGSSSATTATATANGKGAGAAGATARETMATLQKAGVKVINRKGEIQDLAGNTPRAAQAVSGGNFKL